MMRSALSSGLRGQHRRVCHAQWHTTTTRRIPQSGLRCFSDGPPPPANTKPSVRDSKAAVLPGSASAATTQPFPPSSATPATPTSSSSALPDKLPLTPLSPNASTQKSPPTSTSPPLKSSARPIPPPPSPSPPSDVPHPSLPPPPPKRRIRFRTYLLALLLLGGASFAGGVYYSLVDDRFHDFFTEYIPFGEEAVLYFEEQEFRRRYPAAAERALGPPRDTGKRVTIPSRSGVSWNVHQVEDKAKEGVKNKVEQAKGKAEQVKDKVLKTKEDASRDSDKLTLTESAKARAQEIKETVKDKTASAAQSAVKAKDEVKQVASQGAARAKSEVKEATSSATDRLTTTTKKSDVESSKETKTQAPAPSTGRTSEARYPILSRIDPLSIKDGNEPIVQDLVKIINDIITVANADNSSGKFTSSINQAKSALAGVGGRILAMKEDVSKAADVKIKTSHEEFDEAAKELIKRFEAEVQDQETRWKAEFEEEKQNISNSYQSRLQAELRQSQDASEKKLRNELLEQAIALKQKFTSAVKNRVEDERDGRLGKLSELASSVDELEGLTSKWNDIVDTNLQNQRLHVALETVRSSLEKAEKPKPFVRELAALKEVASNDAVVNAAIASINPTAYQKGIATSAQLIDRFRRVATEVRKASLLSDDAGVASHATSLLFSKLLFRRNGLADGNDVESVLTRTETLLEEGDLDGAAREMNGLNGWARTLSKDWLGEVRKVLEVQQALEVIATKARLQSLRFE